MSVNSSVCNFIFYYLDTKIFSSIKKYSFENVKIKIQCFIKQSKVSELILILIDEHR